MNPLATFEALIQSAAWPTLRLALHALFLLSLLYLLGRLFAPGAAGAAQHARHARRALVWPSLLLGLLFAAVLAYQASWQLAGLTRPRFVAFMQTYDRREFNPAHRIERGRILDRRGQVLAYSAADRHGRVLRVYPLGPALAHGIGYSHPKFGAAGIEAAANAHLNGSAPADMKAWGALGRQLLTPNSRPRGQDLALTLDAGLQQAAAALLADRRGAIVMLRPADGAILALASAPGFDPNRLTADLFQDPDPRARLLNRALHGRYPPGSTYKLVVAAAALDAGIGGPLHCAADGFTTSVRYPKIRDHEYYSARRAGQSWHGHGTIGLAQALAVSCNVYFARLGVELGTDRMAEAATRCGVNRDIALYRSAHGSLTMASGAVPRLPRSDQYGLAQIAIGQGKALVTPAHMALIAAAIANRGLAMRPRIVASDPAQALGRCMTETSARRLATMLRGAVTAGTARDIDTPGLAIAGKTGTAQNPLGDAHSWFVGFAPAARPELAIAVLIEQGGYGSRVAAPIARDLFLTARHLDLLP